MLQRLSKDAEDRLGTPSKRQWPVQHGKPWPGTPWERESEAAQETPGAAIWRLTQRGRGTPGENLRGWPRIGMPGEVAQAAYALVWVKGDGDDDDDDDPRPRIGVLGELM